MYDSDRTYHEYTSSLGGKTFLPDLTSVSMNFFNAINSGLTISSLSKASQLGSRVLISRLRYLFCSGVSVATHASLLNLDAGLVDPAFTKDAIEDADPAPAAFVVPADGVVVFGGPKNEVMLPSVFGFLLASVAPRSLFRFSGAIVEIDVYT